MRWRQHMFSKQNLRQVKDEHILLGERCFKPTSTSTTYHSAIARMDCGEVQVGHAMPEKQVVAVYATLLPPTRLRG